MRQQHCNGFCTLYFQACGAVQCSVTLQANSTLASAIICVQHVNYHAAQQIASQNKLVRKVACFFVLILFMQ